MAQPLYSIGIDLGTTNCAIAFCALDDAAAVSSSLPVLQWETPTSMAEFAGMPSFLWLPTDAEREQIRGRAAGTTSSGASSSPAEEWVVGRLARNQAALTPERVVHSSKSWLGHHAVDRAAAFLPWGTDAVAAEKKISPIRAAALLLNYIQNAWNQRFAEQGTGAKFANQDVTITVPASFDAAAQRLTLEAAAAAGFPERVRLLEEPQAAFYRWLEEHEAAPADGSQVTGQEGVAEMELSNAAKNLQRLMPDLADRRHVILVVDIGGGTSDFSLFDLALSDEKASEGRAASATAAGKSVNAPRKEPDIRRVAVSDHILLGGDNIDLALAHALEARVAGKGKSLAPQQWQFLVARSRDLKEKVLATEVPVQQQFAAPAEAPSTDDPRNDVFSVSVPGRGSGLLAGTLTGKITRGEILDLVLDGFFPICDAAARPAKSRIALKELGLPYAEDGAVTHHLAAFLEGQPRVDAILYNGGTLHPAVLRRRIAEQIASWQGGAAPIVLDNAEPDLAVARGAARYGWLVHRQLHRIESAVAQGLYLEVHTADAAAGPSSSSPAAAVDQPAAPSRLICVLPRGTRAGEDVTVSALNVQLRVGQYVKFQPFTSIRRADAAGEIVEWNEDAFHALPPLQTTIALPPGVRPPGSGLVRVNLRARVTETGLLQIFCDAADASWPHSKSWQLDFRLRQGGGDGGGDGQGSAVEPNVAEDKLNHAKGLLQKTFARPVNPREKLTATKLFLSLQDVLKLPKQEWNLGLVRALWPAMHECMSLRKNSMEHEETWLGFTSYVLRPGYGAEGDPRRIDELWALRENGLAFPGKDPCRLQLWILWRRVAGGLDAARQVAAMEPWMPAIRESKKAPNAELVRMAGALERLPLDMKRELLRRFVAEMAPLAAKAAPCDPYLVAIGRLLNRTPLHAGPESIMPPELVEDVFEPLKALDWTEPVFREVTPLFLRAARLVNVRGIDLDASLRTRIVHKLESSGVSLDKIRPLEDFIPIEKSDRAGIFGEALPPGLVLA
ncbi:hypothetical protein DB346_04850 [Verrucomicrobia bacterium LW23]|nr:hypothetical protein DB346_04850 [Verrucomicrobia bacterium LW23]